MIFSFDFRFTLQENYPVGGLTAVTIPPTTGALIPATSQTLDSLRWPEPDHGPRQADISRVGSALDQAFVCVCMFSVIT